MNTKENMRRLMFSFLCFIQVLRVKVSHAQMSRIGYWELAHGQTYSSEDVYGERRINEQLCCEWRHGSDVVLITILGHKA